MDSQQKPPSLGERVADLLFNIAWNMLLAALLLGVWLYILCFLAGSCGG